MDDTLPMGFVQGASDLGRVSQRLVQGQRSSAEALGQGLALQVFHHQEQGALVPSHVVQRADVRVIQPGDGARLAFETRRAVRVRPHLAAQHLDRDHAIQTAVARLVDLAHAAGPQEGEDLVGSEPRADGQARRRLRSIALDGDPGAEIVCGEARRRGEELAGFAAGLDERFDLAAQVGVPAAGLVKEGRAFLGRAVERGGQDLLDATPAFVGHQCAPGDAAGV